LNFQSRPLLFSWSVAEDIAAYVRFLVYQGANIRHRNSTGKTCIQALCKHDSYTDWRPSKLRGKKIAFLKACLPYFCANPGFVNSHHPFFLPLLTFFFLFFFFLLSNLETTWEDLKVVLQTTKSNFIELMKDEAVRNAFTVMIQRDQSTAKSLIHLIHPTNFSVLVEKTSDRNGWPRLINAYLTPELALKWVWMRSLPATEMSIQDFAESRIVRSHPSISVSMHLFSYQTS
jgi:hypothetical protein